MRLRSYVLSLIIALSFTSLPPAEAQLPDGSIAPDFTLTDIEGNTHNLYSLLDAGKSVVLDFSATWCSICWNYHNSHALSEFYFDYGPNGSDMAMVFFIEGDLTTDLNDLNGDSGQTQGDWVDGTPYPIIDLQNAEVRTAYDISFYPTIYKICPDRKIYEIGLASETELASWVESCAFEVDVDEITHTQCFGEAQGAIALNTQQGASPITYNWSDGSSQSTLSNIEAGFFDVTVTEGNGREMQLLNIEVEGPFAELQVLDHSIVNNVCADGADGAITVVGAGGTGAITYSWFNGVSGPIVESLPSGIYYVELTDANGCSTIDSFEVTGPLPIDVYTETQPAYCGEMYGWLFYDIAGGAQPYTVDIATGTVDPNDNIITDLSPGTHEMTVTDSDGCSVMYEFVIETVEQPTVELMASNMLSCATPSATISAEVDYAGSHLLYQWTTPSGTLIGDTEEITVDQAGVYSLLVTDTLNECQAEELIEVTGDLNPPEADFGFTANQLQVFFTDNSSGMGLGHLWDLGDGNTSTEVSPVHVYAAEGTYQVCLIATNSCGVDTTCIEVEVSDSPPLIQVLENMTPVSCFGSQDGAISLDVTGGVSPYTYTWTGPNGFTSTEMNITNLFAGSYFISIDDSNDNSIFMEVTVTSPEAIHAVVQPTSDLWGNGIDLTVEGGVPPYIYSWNNGSSAEDQYGLTDGVYMCTITDANGCAILSDSIQVSNPINVETPTFGQDIDPVSIDGNASSQPLVINVSGADIKQRHEYHVFNISGMLIAKGTWYGATHQVDLRSEIPGIYVLMISGNSDWISNKKVFVGG